MQSVNGLYNGMQALASSAIITGAARVADELLEIGGNAQEARVNLEALTDGQVDAYMNAVTEGADGMISRLDAMTTTSSALNYGLKLNAEQIGDLAEASTVFADVMGTDTTTAYEQLIDAVGRGNARMLQQMGIVVKGKDLQAEINKQLAANTDLTYSQAAQLAALNLVTEKANELKAAGIGQTGSMADAQERMNARVENAKTDVGEWLANGLLPWVEGTEALNAAYESAPDAIAKASDSYAEYRKRMEEAGLAGGGGRGGSSQPGGGQGMMSTAEFNAMKASSVTDAVERNAQRAREAAIANNEYTTTVDQLDAAFGRVASKLEEYTAGLEQQAQVSMAATDAAGLLASGQAKASDVFGIGMNLMGNYNLSVFETKAAYEALGLATGELTQKDIALGDSLTTLSNMAATGTITWDQYGADLVKISQGHDAAAIAAKHQADALMALAANEQARQHGGGVETESTGAPGEAPGVSLEEVQAELAEYQKLIEQSSGQVQTEFATNLDEGVLEKVDQYAELVTGMPHSVTSTMSADTVSAYKNVDSLVQRIAAVKDKTVTLTANVVVNDPSNFLPQVQGASGPG